MNPLPDRSQRSLPPHAGRALTPETVETEAALRQHAATATPEERETLHSLILHPETHSLDPRANEPA